MQSGVKFIIISLLSGLAAIGTVASGKQLFSELMYFSAGKQPLIDAKNLLERSVSLSLEPSKLLRKLSAIEERLGRPLHARYYTVSYIQSRPTWPYAWVNLLEWEYRYGISSSDTFLLALERSVTLGEHSHYLIRKRGRIALELLDDELPEPVSELLTLELEKSLTVRGWSTLGYALLNKREEVICNTFPESEELQTWCDGARNYRLHCAGQSISSIKTRNWCQRIRRYWTVKEKNKIY